MHGARNVSVVALALGLVALALVHWKVSEYRLPDSDFAALAASLPFFGVSARALTRCYRLGTRSSDRGGGDLVTLLGSPAFGRSSSC